MKKLSLFYSLLFIASVSFLGSCGNKDDDEPTPTTPDECAQAEYPTSTGTATISILNFQSSTINVSAGDLMSFAVSVKKGDTRTKKLKVYQSDCKNTLGSVVEFKGQPKFSGESFDLRNTDDDQIRNVNYTVPSGMSPIYLSFVTEEGGNNLTYKQVTLNVSGSGLINDWSGIELGGNSNTAVGSRMSSGTGLTYFACDAAGNIEYIDITYAVNTTTPWPSYICSNPARFLAPVSLTAANTTCGDDVLPTDGGKATYFKTSSANFDAATDASLSGLSVSTADNQYVEVTAADQVFEFLNSDGKKGLIKVTAVNNLNNTNGSITVAVKVQR